MWQPESVATPTVVSLATHARRPRRLKAFSITIEESGQAASSSITMECWSEMITPPTVALAGPGLAAASATGSQSKPCPRLPGRLLRLRPDVAPFAEARAVFPRAKPGRDGGQAGVDRRRRAVVLGRTGRRAGPARRRRAADRAPCPEPGLLPPRAVTRRTRPRTRPPAGLHPPRVVTGGRRVRHSSCSRVSAHARAEFRWLRRPSCRRS